MERPAPARPLPPSFAVQQGPHVSRPSYLSSSPSRRSCPPSSPLFTPRLLELSKEAIKPALKLRVETLPHLPLLLAYKALRRGSLSVLRPLLARTHSSLAISRFRSPSVDVTVSRSFARVHRGRRFPLPLISISVSMNSCSPANFSLSSLFPLVANPCSLSPASQTPPSCPQYTPLPPRPFCFEFHAPERRLGELRQSPAMAPPRGPLSRRATRSLFWSHRVREISCIISVYSVLDEVVGITILVNAGVLGSSSAMAPSPWSLYRRRVHPLLTSTVRSDLGGQD